MNAKKAKALRRAAREAWHDKVLTPIVQAHEQGKLLTEQQILELPMPHDLYKRAKKKLKRAGQ
jgi:hypothetical protein